MLDFAGTSCKDVFNSLIRKVSLFIDVIDVILQHLHREQQHALPNTANLFVEKLLIR